MRVPDSVPPARHRLERRVVGVADSGLSDVRDRSLPELWVVKLLLACHGIALLRVGKLLKQVSPMKKI